MEVQSRYVLSALDCIRVGLLHYELRDRMRSRARAAVQLSTATEHVLREKLRLLGDSRYDGWITYSELVRMLTPGYVRPQEARALKSYRKLRDRCVHDAAEIERKELTDFERSTAAILRFVERFVREELEIHLREELHSPFILMLQGEELDLHDKADLRSKAALAMVTADDDVEAAAELANEAFELGVGGVACGLGLPAASCPIEEIVDFLQEREEGCYFVRDELQNLEPHAFREHYANFSRVSEVEQYVRDAREAVLDLMERSHRPRWEPLVRERWPQVVELLRAVSPNTCQKIPEDPDDIRVTGTT